MLSGFILSSLEGDKPISVPFWKSLKRRGKIKENGGELSISALPPIFLLQDTNERWRKSEQNRASCANVMNDTEWSFPPAYILPNTPLLFTLHETICSSVLCYYFPPLRLRKVTARSRKC